MSKQFLLGKVISPRVSKGIKVTEREKKRHGMGERKREGKGEEARSHVGQSLPVIIKHEK